MRVLVCGGRDFGNYQAVASRLTVALLDTPGACVIQGGASGADALARRWCADHGVECRTFYARWDLYGKKAGPMRNQRMIDEARPTYVIAFPGGRGTADMVRRARAAALPVDEVT